MAPKYVLHYFDARGRAEIFRWMFEVKGVDYEDKRYTSEEWAEVKAKMPYGQLPVLEVDGKMLAQTNAIALYLSSVLGFNGETPMAAAEGAMVAGCTEDAVKVFYEAVFGPSDEAKAAKMKEFLEVALPKLLKFLSCQLKGKEWLTGSKMTVADIIIARLMADLPDAAKEVIKTFADVQALVDKVVGLPAITAWIEKRPKTAM